MVEVRRGQIWWADLGEPKGSRPGLRRPVLVVQRDTANQSRLVTTIVAAITSNLALRQAPGNVFLASSDSGLERDSVINVSQLYTLDKNDLEGYVGPVPHGVMSQVDEGLRYLLSL
ncbi:type II toxin-antitoxin system PemK/MazF family toxin [Meiothermus cerbereus]|uniref:type II toxin-antitoxin system PemK/MazF family toxin n=1 Tax=Meiothermus cerbereus TaxID=65552 RepID=UPI003EEFF2E7